MNLPPITHPTWRALVQGQRQHKFASVAAQMFVLKASIALKADRSPEAVHRLAGELRQLFVDNADSPSLQRDAQALFG